MFKRKMGIPLMQFCNQRRIQTAIRYFQNTDHSVYEVADLVGINNASNFTKMFKRYTGTPPLKYKKEVVLDREKTSIAPL
jgi:YesN/AraC family two-component response regulator